VWVRDGTRRRSSRADQAAARPGTDNEIEGRITRGDSEDLSFSRYFKREFESAPFDQELSGGEPAAQVEGNGAAGRISAELRMAIERRLPNYMAPNAIVLLERLPLTPNGKLDRKSLPAPKFGRAEIGRGLGGGHASAAEGLVAPRDLLEFRMVQIWESVLGVRPIGVRDNFFDLGGHSLLAASLVARIRDVVGRDFPLSAVFQGGTIERLAALLRREATSMSWSCLVGLQTSGSRPPLFFAHPGGGDVLCYSDLARRLGSDQPFYGLQSAGFYGERDPHARIEDMAAHYLEELSAIQPQGPYQLGGWSLGGIVAYEMAQQLVARGQEVSRLLLLDTTAASYPAEHLEEDDAMRLLTLFAGALPISSEELARFDGDERIGYVLKRATAANLLPPDIEVAQARSFLKVYKANIKAARAYALRPYPGAVTLFKTARELAPPPSDGKATDTPAAEIIEDPTMGWGELAGGGVNIINAHGKHATMINHPHVEILALQIMDCLDDDSAG